MGLGLEQMAPQDSEYAVLRRDYTRYRGYAAQGGWPQIYTGVSMAELQSRLEAEGYVVNGDSVVAALKKWQEHHDLVPDGKIGKATFAALNVSAEERVDQIATNMERHRWLPRALGQRYVYVNVPSFRLDAYDSGQRALSMRVIVGADYKEKSTPVFSDVMRSVVFRPYWRPTTDIMKKEILPKLKTDTTYLSRNDMEWAKGTARACFASAPARATRSAWRSFSSERLQHLSPRHEQNRCSERACAPSHGCIRVQHPIRSPSSCWVVGHSVTAAMQAGKDCAVTLPQRLPVYIVYFTAYARDGDLHFATDVYKRDSVFKAPLPTAP